MAIQDIILAREWKGLNRVTAPHLLGEGESPETLDAGIINQRGVIGKRRNRKRIFTNTTAGKKITGVVPFNLMGSRGRIIAYSDGFYVSHDRAWAVNGQTSSLGTLGSDDGTWTRGAQYRNNLYTWNNRQRMARVSLATSFQKAGIVREVFTPTAVTGAAGLLTGRYYYYVVPVNSKKTDPFGRPARGIPSAVSLVVSPVLQQVTVGNIPNNADAQVDKWYIYRNRSGYLDTDLSDEDQDFFYVGEVTDGTATFSDNTPDANLNEAERMAFSQNIPPTCKFGAMFGERLFQAGFDPLTVTITDITGSIATVTCTSNGVALTALPTGLLGCNLVVATLANAYTITVVSGMTVTLDSVTDLTAGAQSTAAVIERKGYQIYYSEFGDPDAWGPNGEAYRYYLEVPGQDKVTGLATFNDQVLIFTRNNIYAIYGKGPNRSDIKISPEPLVRGIGAVGQEAIFSVDNELFFVSQRGIHAMSAAGGLRAVAPQLNNDWLDGLTAVQGQLVAVGGDADYIYVSFPGAGKTENSRTWRIERTTGLAWEERGGFSMFFTDLVMDSAAESLAGGAAVLYAVSGGVIYQPNVSTAIPVRADMIDDHLEGTVTGITATTMTDTGGVFGTNTKIGAYVDFYQSSTSDVLLTRRKIISHTGTVFTWSTDETLDGGGDMPLTLTNYSTLYYRVGVTQWTWKSRVVEAPARSKTEAELHVSFASMAPPPDVYPNLITFGSALDDASWTKTNATVTANAEIAPDGTLTADRLIEDATNARHAAAKNVTLAVRSYTYRVMAHPGTKQSMMLYVSTATAGLGASGYVGRAFNLMYGYSYQATLDGTTYITNPSAWLIQPQGDGWYLCSITFSATVAGTYTPEIALLSNGGSRSYAGSATLYSSFADAQLDLGDFSHLLKFDYVDGLVLATNSLGGLYAVPATMPANQRGKKWDLRLKDRDYQCLVSSRDDAQVRSLVLKTQVEETDR